MTHAEIIKRLTWIAEAKLGEPFPEWMGGFDWGPPLSELARETLKYIEDLEYHQD
jgi:hypothetical protein